MKKLKYPALAAALSLTMSCAPAFAAEMPASAENDYSNAPENYTDFIPEVSNDELFALLYNRTGVMFNGKSIALNDSPVNIDGRVKLPFRELMEKIGAAVDYDEAASKVSAERKGIKIEFFLNSDKIYINHNGEQSEIQMDSSIDIINDKAFVPVRFIAEAFGLSVGWDRSFNAVVITDFDEYINTINENCSNYMKFSEMQSAINENYLSNMKLSFSYNSEYSLFGTHPVTEDIKVNITSASQKDKEHTKAHTALDFSYLDTFQEDNINLSNLQFNIILDKDKLYLSTNLADVLKEAYPGNETLELAASVLTPDIWLESTPDEFLVDLLGMDNFHAEMLSVMLTQPQSLNKVLSSLYTEEVNNNSFRYARTTAGIVHTMKNMFGNDKFILNENSDGSYSFDYKFTNDNLEDFMFSVIAFDEKSDEQNEEYYQMPDSIDINIAMNGTVSDKETNSAGVLSYSIDADSFKMNVKLDLQTNSEAGAADLSGTELPAHTMNLDAVFDMLESAL